jgi:hypothetical protein
MILRPLRGLMKATSTAGRALCLAIAYPMAKRFRTGATLVMYTLITLVVVLLIEIAGLIDKSIDHNIADASAGYSMRIDVNPASARQTIAELTGGGFPQISALAPLTIADALSTDPGGRTSALLSATVVGVPDNAMSRMPFDKRLSGMNGDAAVWRLLARDPRYVVLDANFGSTGGPQGQLLRTGRQAGSDRSAHPVVSIQDDRGHPQQRAGLLSDPGAVRELPRRDERAAFQGVRGGYPIEWAPIGALAAGTILISILITMFPARCAARVQPAIAVRVSD